MRFFQAGLLYSIGFILFAGISPSALSDDLPVPSACPSGRCAGLGQAYYLPSVNLLDPVGQTSGRQILKQTGFGVCATRTASGSTQKDFETYEKTTSALNAWGGKIYTQGQGANATISGFSLKATLDANYDQSSLALSDLATAELKFVLVDSVIDLIQSDQCWSQDNLDSRFLSSFEGLPLIETKGASEGSNWADYRNFLQSWGSHIQVKQELGSRFSILESQKTTDKVDVKTLKAKACFSLGFASADVPVCGEYNNSQKLSASTRDVFERIYVVGGAFQERNRLTAAKAGQYSSQDVLAFINSANNGDQPIGFRYRPIWELLMDVYRSDCTRSGKGSLACQNMQRAVNLQAAFEGFLAYSCVQNRTRPQDPNRSGLFVQGMVAKPANSNGIHYYACHQAKSGCSDDNDCDGQKFGLIFTEKACFCAGPGCVTSEPIPGGPQYRSVIKTQEPNWSVEKSNVGVNASCRDDESCTCNVAWGGGQQEREIWDQASGGGGSGTQIAKTAAQNLAEGTLYSAKALDTDTDSEVDRVFRVTVILKDERPKNRTEAREDAKRSSVIRELEGTQSFMVWSSDASTSIECPGKCSAEFNKGSSIVLTAENRNEARFRSWSRNTCTNQSGTGRICELKNIDGDITVEAFFD